MSFFKSVQYRFIKFNSSWSTVTKKLLRLNYCYKQSRFAFLQRGYLRLIELNFAIGNAWCIYKRSKSSSFCSAIFKLIPGNFLGGLRVVSTGSGAGPVRKITVLMSVTFFRNCHVWCPPQFGSGWFGFLSSVLYLTFLCHLYGSSFLQSTLPRCANAKISPCLLQSSTSASLLQNSDLFLNISDHSSLLLRAKIAVVCIER